MKGATALLARDLGVRGSLDIDLYRAVAREVAESDLRRAGLPTSMTGSGSRSVPRR